MDNGNRPEWMSDPLVKDIPKEKLDFLSRMFQEIQGKNQKELISALMPMLSRAKRENLNFTPQEMGAAIAAIKSHSSAAEREKIDGILEKAKKQER